MTRKGTTRAFTQKFRLAVRKHFSPAEGRALGQVPVEVGDLRPWRLLKYSLSEPAPI